MAITGNTEVAATKQDLIAAVVQKELKFSAKLLSTVTDVSQFALPGMKSISFPKLTSFTVEKRASGVAGTPQVLTSSADKLDLDENAYISWLIDSSDLIQSRIDYQLECASRAAAAHGRQVDLDLIAELLAVAGLDVGPGPITRDKILDGREFLRKNDADLNNSVLVIAPTEEKAMLKIDEFTRAEVYGAGAPIASGVIGRVYGMPVVIHNGLADRTALMYEKTGCAIGFQKAPAYDEQKAIDYGTGAVLSAMDQLYGIKGMQLGEKGLLATQSPLVVKMVTP